MSYATAWAAIESRFAAAILAAYPAPNTPAVSYPNEPFKPVIGKTWLRVSVIDGTPVLAGYQRPGANLHRHPGIVQIDVMAPLDFGLSTALWTAGPTVAVLADTIAGIFRNWSSTLSDGDALRMWSVDGAGPSIKSIGEFSSAHGAWWQTAVSCPFFRDAFL